MAEKEAKSSPTSKQRESRKSDRRQKLNQKQTGKVVSQPKRQTGAHSSNRGGDSETAERERVRATGRETQ